MRFCSFFPHNIEFCEYGFFCSFAHSENDIKIDLYHRAFKDRYFYINSYKTVWCPYTCDHNKMLCPYSHNWQEFRRKPTLFDYSAEVCEDWNIQNWIFN